MINTRKIFTGIMAFLLIACTGVLTGCGSKAKDDNKKVDLTPNDAGDFIWRELTADDVSSNNRNLIGSIIISKYVGSRSDVVVPASINDKPVVGIDKYTFCPLSTVERIKDVYGIMDEDSFYKSQGIDDIYIYRRQHEEEEYDELCRKYDEYFKDTLINHEPVSPITSIRIPKSVASIGDFAFAYCDRLEVVEVYNYGENDRWITIDGDEQFYGNTKLKSTNFYLSDNGNASGSWTYPYCPSLESINLISTTQSEYDKDTFSIDLTRVFELGEDGTDYMTNLKTIHIAEGTKKLSGFKCSDHGESDKEETDSYDYTTDDTDSESDKKIDSFYYMADTLGMANFEFNPFADFNVTEIYIPSSVTEIDEMTFSAYCGKDFEDVRYGKFVDFEMTEQADITIITPQGSYAEMFAKEHGIDCVNSEDKLKNKKRDNSAKEKKLQKIKDTPEDIEKKAFYEKIIEVKAATQSAMQCIYSSATELDEEGFDFTDYQFDVISTDDSKNINDGEKFKSRIGKFFDCEKYDFFAIFKDWKVVYVAVADKEYPNYAISLDAEKKNCYTPSGERYNIGDYSLDDLYKLAKEYYNIEISEPKTSDNSEPEIQKEFNNWNTAYEGIINDIDANGGKPVTKVNTDSGVSIRKEKSADSERLGAVPYHCDVEVLEKGNDWTKITYNGTTGYVKSEYLSSATTPYASDYEYSLISFVDIDGAPLLCINSPDNMNVGKVYSYANGKAELVLETLPEQKVYNNSSYGAKKTCFVVCGTVNRDDPKISLASYDKYYTYNNGKWVLEDEFTALHYTDGKDYFCVENTDMEGSDATDYMNSKYETHIVGSIWYRTKEVILEEITAADN